MLPEVHPITSRDRRLTGFREDAILPAESSGKRRDAVDRLTIIAKPKAKSGAEEQLFEECRRLVGPTLAEEGWVNYDMHRSVEDPGLIMFYENWANRPLWERHMESPHLQEFSANTDDIVEVRELFQGEKAEGA
jgi:quinol monooxygenase YgiN